MMIVCGSCGVSFDFGVVPDSCPRCKKSWVFRMPIPERVPAVPPCAAIPDFEFGPLARYLDSHPGRHAAVLRHDGKWVIRVGSLLGFGATLAEASASVCNALFVATDDDPFSERAIRAELPTIPEKP